MFVGAIITVIVLIILVLIWWAVLKSKRNKGPVQVTWPPPDYMRELGGKCPDYWTYLGDNGGENMCENTYGFKIKPSCKITSMTKSGKEYMNFPKYKNWPPTGNALKERCDWIQRCGQVGPKGTPLANTKVDATWIGMDTICSNNV
tara:strand:+ start:3004 stop:3441 length:438 start_codon:yes stop_codon:yes gene_type:complete